jgi:hypothetical protein
MDDSKMGSAPSVRVSESFCSWPGPDKRARGGLERNVTFFGAKREGIRKPGAVAAQAGMIGKFIGIGN